MEALLEFIHFLSNNKFNSIFLYLLTYVSVCQRINKLLRSSVKNKHCKKRVEEVDIYMCSLKSNNCYIILEING